MRKRKRNRNYKAKVANKRNLHKHVKNSKSLHKGQKKAMHNIIKKA